ncbi:MAG TPA: hypothetical protein IAC41_05530 [Candidatus Merdenecus merdavium]|nr:hypothetical protein [Candidatus Merdenecus merdavium]
MRIYRENQLKDPDKVYCNRCGKKIKVDHGIVKEGALSLDISWGYFSNKDGQAHSFDLCEECYDEMIANFQIPITKKDLNELI